MGRPCTVCAREDLPTIDDAIVRGVHYREIARRFAPLTRDSIKRHADTHISPGIVTVAAQQRAQTTLERIEGLVAETKEIFDKAKAGGNTGLALQAVDRLLKGLELIARARGEMKGDQVLVVNLSSSAEWVELRGRVLMALEPYPEARFAVAGALTDGIAG